MSVLYPSLDSFTLDRLYSGVPPLKLLEVDSQSSFLPPLSPLSSFGSGVDSTSEQSPQPLANQQMKFSSRSFVPASTGIKNEKKRPSSSQEVELDCVSSACSQPGDDKRDRRKRQNREAAATSRMRKKAYLANLEAEVNKLKKEQNELQAMLETLMTENSLLKSGSIGVSQTNQINPALVNTSVMPLLPASLSLMHEQSRALSFLPPQGNLAFQHSFASFGDSSAFPYSYEFNTNNTSESTNSLVNEQTNVKSLNRINHLHTNKAIVNSPRSLGLRAIPLSVSSSRVPQLQVQPSIDRLNSSDSMSSIRLPSTQNLQLAF
jgi:hypothetical protein